MDKSITINKSANDMNVITHLLDPECTDNVVLYDNDNNAIEFEQIALVPIGLKIGVLMQPVTAVHGQDIADNEYVIFVIEEANDKVVMYECTDPEEIAIAFEAFSQLIGQE